jgi:chitin disaccharide deacetylase
LVKLVVCADDFAIHREASEGIATLAHRGRLSATSVMSLSPRWSQDGALLAPLRGRIDVGLHLDWTSEFARAKGGSSLLALMAKTQCRLESKASCRRLIQMQLDQFEMIWRGPPDFIDGHQHIHQFPVIREVLIEEIVARYTVLRPYLRISNIAVPVFAVKARLINTMGAKALAQSADQSTLAHSLWLLGTYNFDSDLNGYRQHMQRWLATARPQSILMCHPAQSHVQNDTIGEARAIEYDYLISDTFNEDLANAGVTVARFGH